MTECPVCHARVTESIWQISAEEAAQHFVSTEGDAQRHKDLADCIRRLWKQENCTIARCGQCGFSFADPFVAGDKAFYNIAYPRPSRISDKWEFDRTLAELSSMNTRMESVLEIGAGFGNFLDKVADRHVPPSGVYAIEYHDEKVKKLTQKGYTARDEDVRSIHLNQKFDAIFMFQVVEHMDDLDSLFKKLSSMLRNTGVLFISVPNMKRIQFQEENDSLRDMPPNHIGRWSVDAFRTIGSRHALQLEKHEVEPFSLRSFATKDLHFFYLRRSQEPGTIENWSRSLRTKKLGKWVGTAAAGLNVPRRIRVWSEAARRRDLGTALWVMFRRSEDGVPA